MRTPTDGGSGTDRRWLDYLDRYQIGYATLYAEQVAGVRQELAAVGVVDKQLDDLLAGPVVPDKGRLIAARLLAVADGTD